MTPEEALEIHSDLIEHLSDRALSTHNNQIVKEYTYLLTIAETFVVSDDMIPLLIAAAEDMPIDMKLDRFNLIAEHGVISCPSEENGKVNGQVAVHWACNKDNIMLWLYWRERPKYYFLIMNNSPLLIPWNTPVYRSFIHPDTKSLLHPEEQEAYRYAIATIQLCSQKVVVPERSHVRRTTERLWRRKFSVEPKLSVVTLRRVQHTNAKGEAVTREYACRWIVKGHWRNQAWGPGKKLRRYQWISPYVKGPDDAPLRVTRKVGNVSR